MVKFRPKRRFFLRRVLPAGVGLVLGWMLAGQMTDVSSAPSPGRSEASGPVRQSQPPATQPAAEQAEAEATAATKPKADTDVRSRETER